VAVASAGPYASLHLAPDRQPHQHSTTVFTGGRMPFLPPDQNSIKALKAVVYPTTAEYCDLQLFSKAHDQSFSPAGP